jgi:energy-coupling factor transport system ATP-binding protein
MSIRGLSHVYSPKTPFECSAISNIDLDIYAGETLGVIGHTGSGKSTLISHLNGLIKPSGGKVLYHGEDIFKSAEFTHKIRFNVGLVLQYPEYQLFEETVYKDIAFGPKNMGLDETEIDRRVRDAANIVGLAPETLEKSPFELSGGQKRRVALAGVFAMEPQVLVLDEPMAGLDPAGREDVFAFIKEYQRQHGITVIFVTHSMEDAAKMADRIIVMEGGHILLEGTPEEIFQHADRLTEAGLNIPQVTQVFCELRKRGVDIPVNVYTVEQALDVLRRRKEQGHA